MGIGYSANQSNESRPSQQLTPKQIDMLRANTEYSVQEIQEWHSNFLGRSPSGKLNQLQFIEMYKRFFPRYDAETFCTLAFSKFDANHDGVIDFNEFLLAVAATCQGNLDDRLEVAFDICDTSDDGLIDEKELAIMVSAMYDLLGTKKRTQDHDPNVVAAKIIETIDIDDDKKLTKSEFIAGCKNNPSIRDLLVPNI